VRFEMLVVVSMKITSFKDLRLFGVVVVPAFWKNIVPPFSG
jgi:hypothetical protein